MSVFKRKGSPYYWIRFMIAAVRIEESTKTSVHAKAKEYHDKRYNEEKNKLLYNKIPTKTWKDATERWIDEKQSKRTINQDVKTLKWVSSCLKDEHIQVDNVNLASINNDLIEKIAKKKESSPTVKSTATVNRTLTLIKSILSAACSEWEWISRVPHVRLRKEPKHRVRYISKDESSILIKNLPEHLADMAQFTLAVGLRASNVMNLRWKDVDFDNKTVFVSASDFKNGVNYITPLNSDALKILFKRKGRHPTHVFTYEGSPIKQCSTKAFRKALKRAKIENFRWHDLRHTWASWHVQSGTSLHELKELGGWKTYTSVLVYAHLAINNLIKASNNIVSKEVVIDQ